jgi:DNA (cytosine-5)-methyltransferase 1
MPAKPNFKKHKKQIFSFFAGAGFLDLGFEKAGFETAFVNELDGVFLNMYKYARDKMKISQPVFGYHQGDMEDLTKDLGKKMLTGYVNSSKEKGILIGFVGGPPCPDFSIAGKNLGRDGKRGKLSETYSTLIIQQKPDFFLFENVKGLYKTKQHKEFYEELKNKFKKSGYVLTERLINAIEYGVAQDRDRIILVGFKKELVPESMIDLKNRQTLLESCFPWSEYIKHPRREIFAKYQKIDDLYDKPLTRKPRGIPMDTTVEYWFKKNSVSKHPNSKNFFIPRQAKARIASIREGNISGKSFKRLHRWKYSPTVAYGHNEVHIHPYEDRRISVSEALALQSLPKEFIFSGDLPLSKMFKAIGNGVPFVAAKAVANTINGFLNSL